MRPFRISLQLYTIRSEAAKDFLGACRTVAAIGYKWVELAGLGDEEPANVREQLDAMGLRVSGSHFGLEAVLEQMPRVVEESNALGTRDVVVPGVPERLRGSAGSWLEAATALDEAAGALAGAGLRLSYHNHDFEFRAFDGRPALDILFESAPRLNAQIDTYWVRKGGHDPSSYIRKVAGRVPSVHVKDMAEDGSDVEFGLGVLDWDAILAACEEAGVETLVAELDNPKLPPIQSAEVCLRNLTRKLGAL